MGRPPASRWVAAFVSATARARPPLRYRGYEATVPRSRAVHSRRLWSPRAAARARSTCRRACPAPARSTLHASCVALRESSTHSPARMPSTCKAHAQCMPSAPSPGLAGGGAVSWRTFASSLPRVVLLRFVTPICSRYFSLSNASAFLPLPAWVGTAPPSLCTHAGRRVRCVGTSSSTLPTRLGLVTHFATLGVRNDTFVTFLPPHTRAGWARNAPLPSPTRWYDALVHRRPAHAGRARGVPPPFSPLCLRRKMRWHVITPSHAGKARYTATFAEPTHARYASLPRSTCGFASSLGRR